MIFQNAELHNVSELTQAPDGTYIIHRFPLSVEKMLSEGGQRANRVSTGVELRFRMLGDSVKIHLICSDDKTTNARAYVYHGAILGGWYEYSKTIRGGEICELVIKRPENPIALRKITAAESLPYDCDLIRVVFDSAALRLLSIDGAHEPPRPGDTPRATYLAYGSSITHGSIGIGTPNFWTSQIATHFGVEILNRGLAGSCRLESEVAEEIATMGARGDWDFATLCMGINILKTPEDEATALVRHMISTVAGKNPEKHIFCISPFYSVADLNANPAPDRWRRVIEACVREYNSPYVHYVNGLSALDSPRGLSADLVHPSPIGVNSIARHLISEISKYISP